MRILLTGSTAAQVSKRKNAFAPTFAGLLYKALIAGGHDVLWGEPSLHMPREYLSEFDAILVGMAPPNSTAAHRIYGALSVIEHANNLGNLFLYLDAPDPKKVWAGTRAIHNRPDDLVKGFYHKRKEFAEACQPHELGRLLEINTVLYESPWPTTIFPQFPWMSFPSVSSYIPQTGPGNLVGINLDSDFFARGHRHSDEHSEYWVSDVLSSEWSQAMKRTIQLPVVEMHQTTWEDNRFVLARLSKAVGCLVSTYKNGDSWWSPALAQALSVGVPVVTDWRFSCMLGPVWTHLAATIEELPATARTRLAEGQRDTYLSAGLSWDDSVVLLTKTLSKT